MNDADWTILQHFARVRNRTIELAERAPDHLLDVEPDGEPMSVRWHLVHIADGPDWWMTHIMRDGDAWSWPPPYAETQAGLLKGLAASRDRVLRFFEAEDGAPMARSFQGQDDGGSAQWTGRDRVLYLMEHEVHHRGRIVLGLMQMGFDAFPGEPGELVWPAAAPDAEPKVGSGTATPGGSRSEVWRLARQLLNSLVGRLERLDALAPAYPDELYEARDTTMEGLQVVDYLERLARHSQHHGRHIASIRASIGRARPTGPGEDADPVTRQPYSAIWYQWFLADALLRRAELVSELVGLCDQDLDRKPSPDHTARSSMTIRAVTEHILATQDWQMRGIEDAISHWRRAAKE